MRREVGIQFLDERWQIPLRRLPQYVKLHVVIVVNNPISHPDGEPPRDVRKLLQNFRREMTRRFANKLESAANGILPKNIPEEFGSAHPAQMLLDESSRMKDIFQIGVILRHRVVLCG